MEFRIKSWVYGYYYIMSECGGRIYLWRDGTTHPRTTGYNDAGRDYSKALGYWASRKEAEEFLNNYENDAMRQNCVVSDTERKQRMMYEKEDFVLGVSNHRYIKLRGSPWTYLSRRGELVNWQVLSKREGSDQANRLCRFESKGHQEETLNKFLGDQNRSKSLEQVRKDIAKHKEASAWVLRLLVKSEKKAELMRLKAPYIFKAGDVCETSNGCKRIIVSFGGSIRSLNVEDGHEIVSSLVGQAHFDNYGYKKIGEIKDYNFGLGDD